MAKQKNRAARKSRRERAAHAADRGLPQPRHSSPSRAGAGAAIGGRRGSSARVHPAADARPSSSPSSLWRVILGVAFVLLLVAIAARGRKESLLGTSSPVAEDEQAALLSEAGSSLEAEEPTETKEESVEAEVPTETKGGPATEQEQLARELPDEEAAEVAELAIVPRAKKAARSVAPPNPIQLQSPPASPASPLPQLPQPPSARPAPVAAPIEKPATLKEASVPPVPTELEVPSKAAVE